MRNMLHRLVDWRPAVGRIRRQDCHHVVLDIRNVPKRFAINSLRLQLTQLTGWSSPGFAYRVADGMAHVWYWDEGRLTADQYLPATQDVPNGVRPWPESLLMQALPDGMHVVACDSGVEARSVKNGNIHRTHWFETHPSSDAWAAFVRDAGQNPDDCPCPPLLTPTRAPPPKGWKVSTHWLRPASTTTWVAGTAIVLLGAFLMGAGTYDLKLASLLESERAELEALKRDSATAIALQQQLSDHVAHLAQLSAVQPTTTQVELLAAFAESGLFGQGSVSLWEWEYRNRRLRALFVPPQQDFSLGEFLAGLEKIALLSNIRLITDSPSGTVGIQADVVARRRDDAKYVATDAGTQAVVSGKRSD
jgi:hypothetical protein